MRNLLYTRPQFLTRTILLAALTAACTQEPVATARPDADALPRPYSHVSTIETTSPKPNSRANVGTGLSVTIASNGQVVLDFEGLADFVDVSTQYVSLGVTFAGAAILNAGGALNPPFPPRSGTGVVFDGPSSLGVIQANFVTPVSEVGGYITGNRVITLRCYSSAGTLLGSMSTPAANYVGAGTGVSPNYFLEVTAAGISRCTFSDGGNTFTIDDFTFKKGCQLTIQRLSQGDPVWGADTYDRSGQTISQLGCALTSLSMALNFAGILNTPRSLNTFMIQTDQDYSGSGVNWPPAVKDRSNGTLRFQALRASTAEQLESALCSGFPVIVGVDLKADLNGKIAPTHFVLVTGKNGTQFLIADPGHAERTTLDDYQNIYSIRGVVVPMGFTGTLSANILGGATFAAEASTPPAELDLAVENAELLLTDASGRRTGFDKTSNQVLQEIPGSVYYRDALSDDVSGSPATRYSSFIQVLDPPIGGLTLLVLGNRTGSTTLSVRGFSNDGTAHPAIVSALVTGPGSTATYQLTFAGASGGTTGLQRIATFESALQDIQTMRGVGLISNQGIGQSLAQKLQAAQSAVDRGQLKAASNILGAFSAEVRAQTGKHITSLAATILLENVASLKQAFKI